MIGNFGDLKLTAGLFYYYERVFDTRSSFFAMGYQVINPTTLRPIALTPFTTLQHTDISSWLEQAVLEAPRLASPSAQQPHGVVREHAVGPATVGDDVDVLRERAGSPRVATASA